MARSQRELLLQAHLRERRHSDELPVPPRQDGDELHHRGRGRGLAREREGGDREDPDGGGGLLPCFSAEEAPHRRDHRPHPPGGLDSRGRRRGASRGRHQPPRRPNRERTQVLKNEGAGSNHSCRRCAILSP